MSETLKATENTSSASETSSTSTNSSAPVSTVGAMLRIARNRRGLSTTDVSNRIRLSLRQINSLETNQFELLPEPMITRGFIRNYARLLEMDAEPLLAAYRSQTQTDNTQSISTPSVNIKMENQAHHSLKMYGIASLLILLSVGAWFIYTDYLTSLPAAKSSNVVKNAEPVQEKQAVITVAPPSVAAQPVPPVATTESAPATDSSLASESTILAAPNATATPSISDANSVENTAQQTKEPALAMAPLLGDSGSANTAPVLASGAGNAVQSNAKTPEQVNPAVVQVKPVVVEKSLTSAAENTNNPPTKGLARLKFVNADKSWIYVIDGNGKEIFNKIKPANSEDVIEGTPPFKLIVGNAESTQVYLNNKSIDLGPYNKGSVARLTLE